MMIHEAFPIIGYGAGGIPIIQTILGRGDDDIIVTVCRVAEPTRVFKGWCAKVGSCYIRVTDKGFHPGSILGVVAEECVWFRVWFEVDGKG